MNAGRAFYLEDVKKKQSFELELHHRCSIAAWLNPNVCRRKWLFLLRQLIEHVRCHFVLSSRDCSVIDDLDKMMEVALEMSFIVKAEQSLQKWQDNAAQRIICFYVIEDSSTFV